MQIRTAIHQDWAERGSAKAHARQGCWKDVDDMGGREWSHHFVYLCANFVLDWLAVYTNTINASIAWITVVWMKPNRNDTVRLSIARVWMCELKCLYLSWIEIVGEATEEGANWIRLTVMTSANIVRLVIQTLIITNKMREDKKWDKNRIDRLW